MKPRINATVIFDGDSPAQFALNAIIARLAGKSVFEQRRLRSRQASSGGAIAAFDIRFNSNFDRDDIKNFLLERLDRPPIQGHVLKAKVTWHDCTHDDAIPISCRDSSYQELVLP